MTPDEALDHVRDRDNECRWTYELLNAVLGSRTAHPSHADPTRISTTVLTNKCLRRLCFERFYEHTVDPDDLWAAFRGTQFHAQLEQHAGPGTYAEARFYVDDLATKIPAVGVALPDDDRSLSGSPDLVSVPKGILYDYKRTKEVPKYRSSPWDDHVEQLNVNRWLVDNADHVTTNGAHDYDLSADRPDINAMFRPVDWQALVIVYVDDNGPMPLTCTESVPWNETHGGRRRRTARVPAIWPDEKVEALIARRYVAARRALNEHLAPMPTGWEHQSHALCVRCPMRRYCAAYEKEGR
jgi:hypothetical protein